MKRRGRLFWRIYRQNLFNLVAIVLLVGAVIWLSGEKGPWANAQQRLEAMLVAQLDETPRDLGLLKQRLTDFGHLGHSDMAIYQVDGTLIADSGRAPQPLDASALPLDGLEFVRWRTRAMQLTPNAYLISHHVGAHPGKTVLGLLLAILLLLALLALPFARSVARPLEKVAATARAIGAGDLTARTGVVEKGEMGQLAAAVDEMAARIQALRQRERALLADVSHELRTPLARMRVALEWAEEDGELPAPLVGTVADLTELERLVTDVLNTARLDPETAALTLDPAPIDVPAFVEAACARARRDWPDHPISCVVDPGQLVADRHLLDRVLANLISNAARYSGAGDPIDIRANPTDGGWVLQVDDRGMGVDPTQLEQIFEPFFRTDASRARATGGSGLGLTLCRRIVKAHGGTIEAATRAGGGLSVRVELPNRPEAPTR